MKTQLLIFVVILQISTTISINSTFNFITNYLKLNNIKLCYFFTCWNDYEIIRLQKIIYHENIQGAFIKPRKKIVIDPNALVNRNLLNIGYIVDSSCRNYKSVLELVQIPKVTIIITLVNGGFVALNGSQHKLFKSNDQWMVFAGNSCAEKAFVDIHLRVDSNVILANAEIFNRDKVKSYNLTSIYNSGGKLITNYVGYWKAPESVLTLNKSSIYELRSNMEKSKIRSAITLALFNNYNRSFEKYMADQRERKRDTMTKFHYILFRILQEMHNFSYDLIVLRETKSNPMEPRNDEVISKMLSDNEIDISASGAVKSIAKINEIEYLMPVYKFKESFLFRNPNVKNPLENQFLKPFSRSVWYTILLSFVLVGIFMKLVFWTEHKLFNVKDNNNSWSTAIMLVTGTLFQQESDSPPMRVAGRLIFIVLLLSSGVLYDYYTSTMVSSLINEKIAPLTTVCDLVQSRLEVGIDQQKEYGLNWFKTNNHSDIKHLYNTKLIHNSRIKVTAKEGMARVQNGGYAFHIETTTGYALIETSIKQKGACDLAEITAIPPQWASFLVQKRSQYAEMFQVSLRKMRQSGVIDRWQKVWHVAKPPCVFANIDQKSVGLDYVLMALLVLVTGLVSSLFLLALEITFFQV